MKRDPDQHTHTHIQAHKTNNRKNGIVINLWQRCDSIQIGKSFGFLFFFSFNVSDGIL